MKKVLILAGIFAILLASCQPQPRTVTLDLLGDLMLGRFSHPTDRSLAYLSTDLQSADLGLANLESPLGRPSDPAVPLPSGYDLCAPPENTQLLSGWGLDLLSLANNHRADCGPGGVAETARLLTAAGLSPIEPGFQPFYRQINGLELAFLAFDDVSAPIDMTTAEQAILLARADGAVVVVSVHWGVEYQSGASDRQKALAQRFAEAGAALVAGTHPHVLQPAVWLPTSHGRTLVLYSLGNALFDQPGLPDTRQSALVSVTLTARGVRTVRAVPFEIDVPRSLIVQPDARVAQQILTRLGLP
jgi:poly-gamma-glutamate capsule biosynthesis protein CapA/YwtB (metallophosphatase superfamily)